MRLSREETVERLVRAIEHHDITTGRHINRIGRVAAFLATLLGHDPNWVELLRLAASVALTHHEHFDGSGYPHALAGEEIPIEGRITAVADVFDALLSDRDYRSAMPIKEAVALIEEGRDTQFDPRIVDLLLGHVDEAISIRA